MKKAFYPFLFAVFPISFLYSHNMDEASLTDMFLPMLVIIVSTLLLFLLLKLAAKSYPRAALMTTFYLFLFFSYGHIRKEFYLGHPFAMVFIWAILFGIGTFLLLRIRKNLSDSTRFLNITSIILIIISVTTIGIKTIEATNYSSNVWTTQDMKIVENSPDIYYIILDTYPSQEVLREAFSYDNSEFLQHLTDRGFYVVPNGESNYPSTHLSLASSLNMRYLGEEEKVNSILLNLIRSNEVSKFLRARGYHLIFVSGGWELKGMSEYVDDYLVYKSDNLLKKTALIKSLTDTTLLTSVGAVSGGPFISYDQASRLYAFEVSSAIPEIREPTFSYIHLMAPHPPFVFDKDGNSPWKGIPEEVRAIWQGEDKIEERYINQLIFVNKKMVFLLNTLLEDSDVPPVIIIQGDHGPWWVPEGHLGILNAYYLPGVEDSLLYETISPVNTFRIIFNQYFGTNFPLLGKRTYK